MSKKKGDLKKFYIFSESVNFRLYNLIKTEEK